MRRWGVAMGVLVALAVFVGSAFAADFMAFRYQRIGPLTAERNRALSVTDSKDSSAFSITTVVGAGAGGKDTMYCSLPANYQAPFDTIPAIYVVASLTSDHAGTTATTLASGESLYVNVQPSYDGVNYESQTHFLTTKRLIIPASGAGALSWSVTAPYALGAGGVVGLADFGLLNARKLRVILLHDSSAGCQNAAGAEYCRVWLYVATRPQ